MSTALLLGNILYVTVIVGTVAASKGHHYFSVNDTTSIKKNNLTVTLYMATYLPTYMATYMAT